MTPICAVSTPPGVGGIAVVRLSGPGALAVADAVWTGTPLASVPSHTAHLGTVLGRDRRPLDQCVATVFRAPRSFTGDDTVEFSVHGSRYIQAELLRTLVDAGARLAEPGEFTRRAFASGRLDLVQAEAVADLIASRSRAAHRIAVTQMRGGVSSRIRDLRAKLVDLGALLELELDFSEEEVQFASRADLASLALQVETEVTRLLRTFDTGSAIRDGIPIAIVGDTNAGKSSLLNALVGDDKAIVSDIHGTTRDIVEDLVTIGDNLCRLMDTAGLRHTDDPVERIGIDRAVDAISRARIVILVADATRPDGHVAGPVTLKALQAADGRVIAVINKTDLIPDPSSLEAAIRAILGTDAPVLRVSALTGQGIDTLRHAISARIDAETAVPDDIVITNARHAEALRAASHSAHAVVQALRDGIPGDLVAQHLRQTVHHLSSITGDIPAQELLSTIFSRFCIGK